MQTILGNVISLNAVYGKIKEAEEQIEAAVDGDDAGNVALFYWYGRMFNLLLIFDPIEIDTLDDELDDIDTPPIMMFEKYRQLLKKQIDSEDGKNKTNKVGFWQVMDYSWNLMNGLTNASFGQSTPNMTVCHGNITVLMNSTLSLATQFKTFEAIDDLNATALHVENILGSAHPLTYSCYFGGIEYYNTTMDYVATFKDWQRVLYNLIHKLGPLYDTIYYTVQHHKNYKTTEFEARGLWFLKIGLYYGTVFHLMFYSNETFEPYDPLGDYSGTDIDEEADEITLLSARV